VRAFSSYRTSSALLAGGLVVPLLRCSRIMPCLQVLFLEEVRRALEHEIL
jgi:hypothetical protein